MKKIILIDGLNLLFRMFYGIPSQIKNSKGNDIRGLIGFVGSLKKIIERFKPYSVFVVFDSQTSTGSNLKIDGNYKANRIDYSNVPLENNPFSQLPLIKKALDYLNIAYLEVENYEADDYIASLIAQDKNKRFLWIIVSTDSDFLQLICDNVFLFVPRGKKSILYNEKVVVEKYEIIPEKYVEYKALVGDKSDNIKGVPGIGKITASKILQCENIDAYIAIHNDRLTNILLNYKDLIIKNVKLISLNKNIDISKVFFSEIPQVVTDYKTYEIVEAIGER